MKKKDIQQLKIELSTKKNIVIVTHKNPDGDAIGSSLALFIYLKKQGHNVQVIVPNEYPDFLKWMPQNESILIYEKHKTKANQIILKAELLFTLDFNAYARAGDMQEILEKATAPFVLIDHHQQPDNYAKYTYSDTAICSTAQMVYHFIEFMDGLDVLDKEIATTIYTGIMTDTGSFRFRSTSSTTHRVVADLIDHGADNAFIHESVFDNNSAEKIKLLGVALRNLKIIPEYRTAYITLSQHELDANHFKKGDYEGFVNYALSVENVILAAIFVESKEDGLIKISFRSKGRFSVNKFARNHFEGGGHDNASGGKSNRSLEDTISYFISKLHAYKKELTNEK
ncbi:MAG: DHH family phosphoesterase [Flavobacteriaceae bacterium CG02_land_8_20_14_3_00_34_13]|nr:MAG: DHH family phosphoesterase [Flavobacteriaceae bacterium CG02_land_8_20_14_3_00_34_13]PJC08280.1 MAG: DHH family phosphoesterase [Flavobacteriaceae bacterium CG_4_9_14_0_8_um_filter_34_30]